MKNYHRLLLRQLKKMDFDPNTMNTVAPLLELVNSAYTAFDTDMDQLENTLEKSSHELFEANQQLKSNVEMVSDQLIRVARNIKEVIFEIDNSGNWTYLNPAWETLTGSKIKDALDKPYHLSFLDANGFPHQDFLDLGSADKEVFHRKIETLTARGSKKWMDFSIRSIWSKDGSKEGFIGTIVDSTDMEIARSRIMKQYNELQNFVYIISHNVRAPIATLQGLVDIFDLENDELNEQIVSNIGTTVDALDRTIKDLNHALSLRNISQDSFEEVALSEVLKDIELLLSKDIEKCDARIEYDLSKVPKLLGIKGYFTNILFNLISNAIEYRSKDRQPHIKVSARPINVRGVEITVIDNGMGMALTKDKQKKIFEMYGRLSGNSVGKGMGLYLVKTQVESMNGQIEVESQPDIGSVFTIVIDACVRPKQLHVV